MPIPQSWRSQYDACGPVELDSLRVRLAPIIDSSKLEEELLTAKPLLVRLKQQHGRVKDRAFAQGLINNDDPPETAHPQLRKLVKIMLTLLATSVQCERDFSAINRLKVKGRARSWDTRRKMA
eukprot:COSAG02_NODE_3653_length_6413_cov_4.685144_6_plen_123_part_00